MVVVIFVVMVYDVGVKRVNRIKALLRQYLNWVQNSVFEGELTESEFKTVINLIEKTISKKNDHLVIYVLNDRKYVNKEEFGTPKMNLSNII